MFATIAKSPKPHTSQPYFKIGAIVVWTSFNWQSSGIISI